MKILSIDCGIKNLAHCICTTSPLHIESWGCNSFIGEYSVKQVNFETQSKMLLEFLKTTYDSKYDIILIENQPCIKNPVMKSIQIIIYTYFLLTQSPNTQVIFLSASSKLKYFKGDKKLEYKDNKKLSIDCTYNTLHEHEMNDKIDELNKLKKKDDICDAFLQIVYYLKRNAF